MVSPYSQAAPVCCSMWHEAAVIALILASLPVPGKVGQIRCHGIKQPYCFTRMWISSNINFCRNFFPFGSSKGPVWRAVGPQAGTVPSLPTSPILQPPTRWAGLGQGLRPGSARAQPSPGLGEGLQQSPARGQEPRAGGSPEDASPRLLPRSRWGHRWACTRCCRAASPGTAGRRAWTQAVPCPCCSMPPRSCQTSAKGLPKPPGDARRDRADMFPFSRAVSPTEQGRFHSGASSQ